MRRLGSQESGINIIIKTNLIINNRLGDHLTSTIRDKDIKVKESEVNKRSKKTYTVNRY